MKNLILTLCFLFTTILFSQSKYEDFVGNWESDKTEYTLVISKHFAKDHFKFLNYKEVFKTTETGEQIVDIEYSEEEFVKVENEKIHTFIAWEYGDDTESYYCDLVYEKVTKNKLKVTFTGSSKWFCIIKEKNK